MIVVAAALAAAVAVAPAAAFAAASAKVTVVDFKGDVHDVRIDREGLAPERITDIGGDSNEWVDANADGLPEKSWPVSYTRRATVTLDATFKLTAVPAADVTFTGVSTNPRLFFQKTVRIGAGAASVTVSDMASSVALPATVLVREPLSIAWTACLPRAGATAEPYCESTPVGTTRHNLYVTYADPTSPLLFTLLDAASHGANGRGAQRRVVGGVWKPFSTFPAGRSRPPVLRRRDYFAARTAAHAAGDIDHRGTPMRYYSQIAPGGTLKDRFGPFACGLFFTTVDLLENAQGRCGAWANAFHDTLGMEGIASTVVGLEPKAPADIFLVAHWRFDRRGTSGDPVYKWRWTEVRDRNGVAGHSVANPQPWFGDHAIVEALAYNRGGLNFYDPSYGRKTRNSLRIYENASISGFCKRVGARLDCKKNSRKKVELTRNP